MNPSTLLRQLPAIITLGVGLVLTFVGWSNASSSRQERVRQVFIGETEKTSSALINRLMHYRLAVEGARGLFAASRSVERHEARAYTETIGLGQHYPAMAALLFVAHVEAGEREAYLTMTREDGSPDYFITPPPADDKVCWPIRFIEPEARHPISLGFDVRTLAAMHAPMQRATATDDFAVGEPVDILQTGTGYVTLTVPVYRNGHPHSTVDDRNAAIIGWLVGVVDPGLLFADAIGRGDDTIGVTVSTAADTGASTATLLEWRPETEGEVTTTTTMDVGQAVQWTLAYRADRAFRSSYESSLPELLLVGGLAISGLLFTVVLVSTSTRVRAERLAERMSRSRELAEARTRVIVESAADSIVSFDGAGRIEAVNPATTVMFESDAAALVGSTITDWIPGFHLGEISTMLSTEAARMASGNGHAVARLTSVPARHPSGRDLRLDVAVSVMEVDGKPAYTSILHDVTERDLQAAALQDANVALEERVNERTAELEGLADQLKGEVEERREAQQQLQHKLELIEEQREAITQLSSPIIEVWTGVLVMPVIGLVDAERAADMLDRILVATIKEHARVMVLDLTGVETIDTATAAYLLKMVRGVELVGGICLLCGISGMIARTTVNLGLELSRIRTLATLKDALAWALKHLEERDRMLEVVDEDEVVESPV